jgi:SAM-dependent methyltransferase
MSIETAIDWRAWATRWERQQNGGLPGREDRFRLMLDLVARQRGHGALRLLDLCCGPGSISARALARFPEASVVAAEIDPWTVEMGRQTVGHDYPGRITWLEADLRHDGWDADLAPGSFDAVLSATAVHWFQPEDQLRLYRRLAALLAEGGLFLNADHFPTGAPTLDPLSRALLDAEKEANFDRPDGENWYAYWDAARAEPAFAALLTERDRRFGERQPSPYKTTAFHREALLAAGFREVSEFWRYHEDAVLVALR